MSSRFNPLLDNDVDSDLILAVLSDEYDAEHYYTVAVSRRNAPEYILSEAALASPGGRHEARALHLAQAGGQG